jgi:DNA-binding beta-propeller fold protein YncE
VKAHFLHICILSLVSVLPAGKGRAQQIEPLPVFGTAMDVDVSGNIFLLDGRNSTLTLYDRTFHKMATAGGPGWENGRFDQPAGVWARNGLDVLVADYGNHRIQRFDRTLSFISALSTRESDEPAERFGYPSSVALSRLGELYLCDVENSRIVKVNAANRVEISFGGFGAGEGRLEHPSQVQIGAGDCVYVLDSPRVLIYDGFGNFLTKLPDGMLKHPSWVFADAKGSLVVDGDSLLFFDAAHHPGQVFRVSTLIGRGPATVYSAVIGADLLYLLCTDGVYVLPDPRSAYAR